MTNKRIPQPLRNYSQIHWPTFIADAIASGHQQKYCDDMNVCRMVYYRRKKEYELCDDPENYIYV